MDERSDRDLLTGHLDGDAEAFSALANRYAGGLFGFLDAIPSADAITGGLARMLSQAPRVFARTPERLGAPGAPGAM